MSAPRAGMRELQRHDEDEGIEGEVQARADNASAGHTVPGPNAVEFTLQELQKDTRKMLEMQVSIMQQVARLETSLQLMPRQKAALSNYSWECKGCQKPKEIIKIPDSELECIVGPYAVTQVVQLFCVIANSSFALQADNARWIIPVDTLACFSSDESIITGGSGLAALFFAVKNNLKRLKFGSCIGRLWAFVMREAVVEAVKYARDVLYGDDDGNKDAPQWLKYMEDKKKICKSVAYVYTKLEGQESRFRSRRTVSGTGSTAQSVSRSVSAGTPPRSTGDPSNFASAEDVLSRKRRRIEAGPSRGIVNVGQGAASGRNLLSQDDVQSATNTGSQGDPGNQSTAYSGDQCVIAVDERVRRELFKTVRGKQVQYLNTGRTDIRSNLYKGVMFLKEFIDVHFDPEKRRSKGLYVPEGATAVQLALPNYEYVFLGDPEREFVIPEVIREGSPWDIPLAETVDACVKILTNEGEGIASNLKTLDMIATRFPCLTVALRYKREVRSESGAFAPSTEDTEAHGTVWHQELEKISLHDMALGMLVERFKARDKKSALCFSPLSFRTVHIIAIGIFGLLRRSLGHDITKVEEIEG